MTKEEVIVLWGWWKCDRYWRDLGAKSNRIEEAYEERECVVLVCETEPEWMELKASVL